MTIHQIRASRSAAPRNDTPALTIKIVESEEDRLKAMLIRAIVYMHGQQCPFREEFDLNDHTATQIIGLINDAEPVLTARIRYFNGFAKLERLAIREEYRGRGYGHQLLAFLLSICRQKGFSRFYLHAQARLQPFYEGYGFRAVGGEFSFSEHGYVEMTLDEREHFPQPSLNIGSRPMALNRPENSMNSAGPLERAANEDHPRRVAVEGVVA